MFRVSRVFRSEICSLRDRRVMHHYIHLFRHAQGGLAGLGRNQHKRDPRIRHKSQIELSAIREG